jgi:hypothetical protein
MVDKNKTGFPCDNTHRVYEHLGPAQQSGTDAQQRSPK